MKYACEILLARPRPVVIALFDNPENLKHWQPDLVSFEPLSGTPGQPGATSRLLYRMGSKTVELIETVTERNLPDTFAGTYTSAGIWNHIHNTFTPVGEQTKWTVVTEFRCRGWLWLMSFFLQGMFRKQTRQFLEQFRAFVESQPTA